MREPIAFKIIDSIPAWEETRLFAASSGHKIDDTSITPLIAMYRGDRMIGYFQLVTHPVLMPSFHTDPSICTPRDFFEASDQLRSWAWINSLGKDPRAPRGMFWLALTDAPIMGPEILEKMGYKNTHCQLWQSFPEILVKQ